MEQYTLTRSDGCVVTGTLVDGKITGVVTVKWPNGMIESVRHYADNMPTGTHTTYSEDGALLSTLEYVDGELVSVDGSPVTPGPMIDLPGAE